MALGDGGEGGGCPLARPNRGTERRNNGELRLSALRTIFFRGVGGHQPGGNQLLPAGARLPDRRNPRGHRQRRL